MHCDDTWILHRTGPVGPAFYIYLANGYLGVRVPPWGNGVGAESECYMSGLHYGKSRSKSVSDSTSTNPPRVRLINWSAMGLVHRTEGGEAQPLLPPADPDQTRETLDLRQATFHSAVEHARCRIEQRVLVHQAYPELAMQEMVVQAREELNLDADLELDPDSGHGFVDGKTEWLARQPAYAALQQEVIGGDTVRYEQATTLLVGGEATPLERPMGTQVTLKPGQELRLRRLTWVTGDAEGVPDPDGRVEILARFDELWQEHAEAWQVRWQSRAEVADPQWQRIINVASYNLKASHRADNLYGVPPVGLSSGAWNGYVFPWDATLWVLPYYLLTEPALGRAMLEFERTGTMLRWPRPEYYAGGEGEKMYEGGCVALAAWRHYQVTQDRAWLADAGIELLEACCKGYARRAIYNEELESYELRGIWPTDEFAEHGVDNDVFTNAIAQKSIGILEQACDLLGRPVLEEVQPLLGRAFWLPFDEANKRHVEYASFEDGRMTRAYDGHAIKQADTNLMSFPLNVPMDDEVRRNNLEYYSAKVSWGGTPEMSWGVFATVAARLGDPDLMMRYLNEMHGFLRTDMLMLHEARDNEGTVFMTGCGDLMQAIYAGCGGVEFGPGAPEFEPCVPEGLGGRLELHGLPRGGEVAHLVAEGRRVVTYESEPAGS